MSKSDTKRQNPKVRVFHFISSQAAFHAFDHIQTESDRSHSLSFYCCYKAENNANAGNACQIPTTSSSSSQIEFFLKFC